MIYSLLDTAHIPFAFSLISQSLEAASPDKLLETKRATNKEKSALDFKHRWRRLLTFFSWFANIWSIQQGEGMTATHTPLPSVPCESREASSGSKTCSSSAEFFRETLSSWFTTSWFRLSGSDSQFTNNPNPGNHQNECIQSPFIYFNLVVFSL